jgi:hypothetical protein
LSGLYTPQSGQIYGVSDMPWPGGETRMATDCSQLLPWLAVLILLNAIEILFLIGVTVRLNNARDTVMEAVEARLLEVEKERF